MKPGGPQPKIDVLQGHQRSETLGHTKDFQVWRNRVRHESASTKASDVATAPNTPPCILTILIAAWWFPYSVAPQQSSSRRHSKPRSLASRMVVCTQTSVVIPAKTILVIPRS